jgi:putative protease
MIKNTGIATIEQRNRMFAGDEIEVVRPGKGFYVQKIQNMKNEDGDDIDVAPHPQMTVYMPMDEDVVPYAMLRRKENVE